MLFIRYLVKAIYHSYEIDKADWNAWMWFIAVCVYVILQYYDWRGDLEEDIAGWEGLVCMDRM